MQTITLKSLKSEIHPQTKMLFWFLFSSSKGGPTRVRIVKLLQKQPYNTHQISKELSMDYKAIKHHLVVLEKNNLLEKINVSYGASYFMSSLFIENQIIFDELISRMNI